MKKVVKVVAVVVMAWIVVNFVSGFATGLVNRHVCKNEFYMTDSVTEAEYEDWYKSCGIESDDIIRFGEAESDGHLIMCIFDKENEDVMLGAVHYADIIVR